MKRIIFDQMVELRKTILRLFVLLSLAVLFSSAYAANVNRKVCFTASNTPVIDGDVVNDAAWGAGQWRYGSWKYTFGNGTGYPNAVVQGTKDSNNLYFSFIVNNDNTADAYDAVVIAIDPNISGEARRKLHIHPRCITGTCPAGASAVTMYTWNGSDWTSIPAVSMPEDVNVASDTIGSTWTLEVQIPDSVIPVPASGDFGLYYDIVRIDSTPAVSTALHMDWPPEAPDVGGTDANAASFFLVAGTPQESVWGYGTRGGSSCNGVYMQNYVDVWTNNTPNSRISLNGPNYFTARVHNSSVDQNGTPAAVQGVRATFRIANWGINGEGGEWSLVPAASNTPSGNIAASSSTDLTTGAWTLSAAQQTKYSARPHQCIRVDLDKAENVPGDISFINHVITRNMDFVTTSSPVSRTAFISAKGYPLPKGSRRHTMILKEFTHNVPGNAKWISRMSGLKVLDASKKIYRLEMANNTSKLVNTAVTPPRIKIPISTVKVLPGAGGMSKTLRKKTGKQPVVLNVVPGNVVTLTSEGEIKSRFGQKKAVSVNPSGVSAIQVLKSSNKLMLKRYNSSLRKLLVKDAQRGSLVGSFDNFKTSFPVGQSSTVRVPKGARKLYLAINDIDGAFSAQSGDGYTVQVTQTKARSEFSMVGRKIPVAMGKLDVALPIGANLPTWTMCGELMQGKKVNINGKAFNVVKDAGCFGYIIRDNRSLWKTAKPVQQTVPLQNRLPQGIKIEPKDRVLVK